MVTPRFSFRFLFCVLTAFAAVATQAQVIIIHAVNQSYADDVKTKLSASGLIAGNLDLFDARTAVAPTLSELLAYKAVFVFSDSPFNNPVGLGNVLADYVDAGGGVVQATFSNFTAYALAGRWETENYVPMALGSYGTSTTLGTISDPSSPIMAGVNSLSSGSSGYYSSATTLRAGGVLIASWADGAPLVVLNSNFNNRVLMLNMYPPSSDALSGGWTSSTDGVRLMANSLNFVAVPEPSTYALLALGGGLLLLAARRRRA